MRHTILLAALLAGCTTTPSELREREIVATFQTTKPPEAIANCLAERFAHVGAPLIMDRDGSKVVSINHDGSTVLMWTIANGSVSVQRANSLLGVRNGTAECA